MQQCLQFIHGCMYIMHCINVFACTHTHTHTHTHTITSYRRTRCGSLPSLLTDAHFQALQHHINSTDPIPTPTTATTIHVTTTTGPTATSISGETSSSYQWALQLWWDRWFPEVLQEYKEIVASYSVGRTLLTLGVGGARGRSFSDGLCRLRSDAGKKEKYVLL